MNSFILSFFRYGAHMEDLVVNGLDVKPINYIAEKVHNVANILAIVVHCYCQYY